MIKNGIVLAAMATLISTGTMAQENNSFNKNNWFVTGGVNTEAFMNTNGYVTATGKVGAGIWLNPWLGLKVEGVAGNTHLLSDSRGQVFGANLTYMAHLYGGKSYKPFNLNGVLGIGFYHHKFGDILKEYSYMNILTGNLGIQAVYNITPKWSVYLEPGIILQPKYYEPKNKENLTVSAYLSAGVTYTFKNQFLHAKKAAKVKKMSDSEIRLMNEQLNDMRAQIQDLQKDLSQAKVVDANKRVILEPMRNMPSVTVGFDAMGSFLSKEETEKINDIGVWMQDHSNSIAIVPFADSQADSDIETRLKQERVKAISDILINQYGIDSKRILTKNAEDLGYVNKTEAAAMVVFLSE